MVIKARTLAIRAGMRRAVCRVLQAVVIRAVILFPVIQKHVLQFGFFTGKDDTVRCAGFIRYGDVLAFQHGAQFVKGEYTTKFLEQYSDLLLPAPAEA